MLSMFPRFAINISFKRFIFTTFLLIFKASECVEETRDVANKSSLGQMSQEEWWSNTDCSSEGCPLENPYTSWNDSTITYTNDSSLVQNSMLRYGSFCGPGPQLLLACRPPVDPVDQVDRVCMLHDIAWCRCYENRIEPIVRNKPHPLILSTRFITLPSPIYRRLFDEAFRDCIGAADESLLNNMDALEAEGKLPEWWDRWTLRKFRTFLAAFRKSVARDKRMRLKQGEESLHKDEKELTTTIKAVASESLKTTFNPFNTIKTSSDHLKQHLGHERFENVKPYRRLLKRVWNLDGGSSIADAFINRNDGEGNHHSIEEVLEEEYRTQSHKPRIDQSMEGDCPSTDTLEATSAVVSKSEVPLKEPDISLLIQENEKEPTHQKNPIYQKLGFESFPMQKLSKGKEGRR